MSLRRLRVFIASPGDLEAERLRLQSVIDELNRSSWAHEHELTLECLRWETHAQPEMGRAQQVILNQLSPDTWDVFIGVLWLRFGSETGAVRPDMSSFGSGTEEEFESAYSGWKTSNRPHIMIYRCTRPPTTLRELNSSQYQRVEAFFERFRHDGASPGLVCEFQNPDQFERLTRAHLQDWVSRTIESSTTSLETSDLDPGLRNQGFLRLFTPTANEERTALKRSVLNESSNAQLMAHSGFSFLAKVGHRYRDLVSDMLSRGGRFRVVIANPWTFQGLQLAIAERTPSVQDPDEMKEIMRNAENQIECSTWFSVKFTNTLSGFRQLRDKFPSQIELKLSSVDIPSSILMTETSCFIEPYINTNLTERFQNSLHTFEIQCSNDAILARHANDLFLQYWSHALAVDEFEKRKARLKSSFIAHLKMLLDDKDQESA